MILLLAASLFFCEPVVPDLPRASAYLEEDEGGASRLADRYSVFDLWTAQRICGRWTDEDGRAFALAVLDAQLPVDLNGSPETRVEFESEIVPLAKDDLKNLYQTISALVPIVTPDVWTKPHETPRTCREVRYCEGTNETQIVAAFLPEKSERWLLAVWDLAEGDDREEFRVKLEEEFFLKRAWADKVPPEPTKRTERRRRKAKPLSERELLRRDLVHSVTNYPAWRVTDSPGYVILDELGANHRAFIARLTNELVAVRGRYAAAVPSPIDGSNTLAIARLYAQRSDYLRAAGPEMYWSAAYWYQPRREIVAYLPEGGEEELLRTLRHEGFHQYLSYAGSMIESAPWINEGYAVYFEADEKADEKAGRMIQALAVSKPKELTESLVQMFSCDYREFYAENEVQREFNYRLAWSVAYFLEVGAPNVRFRPFANLTKDYMSALMKTRDRARATEMVLGEDMLKRFVSEWLKFWKDE